MYVGFLRNPIFLHYVYLIRIRIKYKSEDDREGVGSVCRQTRMDRIQKRYGITPLRHATIIITVMILL
jgi:hypothetical protein